MELFYFPVSPFSHKVQLALAIKGIDCELRPIRPYAPEERARYRETYPLGKLPLLQDKGVLIPESSFIVEYLDAEGNSPALIPSDAKGSRDVRLKDRLIDCYVIAPAIAWFFENLRPESQRDSSKLSKGIHEITQAYKMLEGALEANQSGVSVLHGATVTLADLSLVAGLRLSQGVVPLQDYPRLQEHFAVHSEMPAFKAIDAAAQAEMGAFVAAITGQTIVPEPAEA